MLVNVGVGKVLNCSKSVYASPNGFPLEVSNTPALGNDSSGYETCCPRGTKLLP